MRTICVDFDGVLHSYTSGWAGYGIVKDPPVPGAMQWLIKMAEENEYEIAIYSSRSCCEEGIAAMKAWLWKHLTPLIGEDDAKFLMDFHLKFPSQKPPAYITIDDRAICFRGTFPSPTELANFKPWNK